MLKNVRDMQQREVFHNTMQHLSLNTNKLSAIKKIIKCKKLYC